MAEKHKFLPQLKEQLTEAVKVFSRPNRPFQKTRREKITDLSIVRPGDHVSFYKTDLYYAHHGIVVEVRSNYLHMIHYFNTLEHARMALMKGSIYVAAIIESDWKVNLESKIEDVFLHHYDNIQCFTHEETLKRAFSQLGRRGYSLLGNNCEHWSRWCRTGEHFSEQIYNFRNLVREKSATLLIVDPTALLIKDVALVGAQSFGQFLSAAGSGLILTVVEGISAYFDIKKKKTENKRGSLSDVALKKYVVRRITSAAGTVIGGTAGTVVGTILIPVPILGATVGGAAGTVAGKLLGGVTGIALSKIIEVHSKMKESKIKKMSTVPRLMNNLSPESELVRGLMTIGLRTDRDGCEGEEEEEEKISNGIEEAINSDPSSTSPVLADFVRTQILPSPEKCEAAQKLTLEIFTDSNSFEHFILTPVPDDNAHEEFASSTDLIVLRWPKDVDQPWNSSGEHVLDIDDSYVKRD